MPDVTVRTIMLVECPHACVNKLRVVVITSQVGHVLSVEFAGHEATHDEWTGRPKPPRTPA